MTNFSTLRRLLLLPSILLLGTLAARAQGVGIGTTAPNASAALDIVSSSKGALLPRLTAAQIAAIATPATGLLVFQTDGTPGFYYNAGTPAAPSWQQLATAAGAAITASNGLTKTGPNVALGGNLTTPVTILQGGQAFSLTGGNVGIGTATPQSTLDVSGDLRVSNGTSSNTLGTGTAGNTTAGTAGLGQSFTLPTAGTITSIRLRSNTTYSTTFTLYSGAGSGGTALAPAQAINFVAGTASTVPLTTPLVLGAGTYTLTLTQGTGIQYYSTGTDAYTGGSLYFGSAMAGGNVDLEFGVGYTSGTATSAFYVGTGGNVGIGTSGAPGQKLDVTGGNIRIGTTGSGLIFPDGTTQTTAATTATGAGFIQNTTNPQAGSNFNISGSGTIGGNETVAGSSTIGTRLSVGTAAPAVAPLNVRGAGNAFPATSGTSQSAGLISRLQTSNNLVLDMGGNSSSGAWLQSTDAVSLGAGYPLLLNPNGGSVGIGTTTPGQALDVAGTVRATNAIIANALTGNGANLGSVVGLGIRTDGGLNLGQNNGHSLYLGYQAGQANTGAENQFIGYQAGPVNTTGTRNVFIGASSGLANVTGKDNVFTGVASGYSTTGSYNVFNGTESGAGTNAGANNTFVGWHSGFNNLTGSNNTVLGYGSGPANGSGALSNATALGANVSLTQSNTLILGNGANVGIGTSTPSAALEAQAGPAVDNNTVGTSTQLRLSRVGTTNIKWPSVAELAMGTYGTDISSQSQLDFKLAQNANANADQTVLTLRGDGRVGIGTTAPAQRLDVTGGSIQISTAGQGLIFPDGTTQTTAATTAAATTASNGLTKTGNNVALGGPLTAATDVPLAGNRFTFSGASGNVGVGTAAPATSAKLEVSSTTQGFLPPRVTASQRAAIASPVAGLLVFQTDGTQGIYYYTGVAWVNLTNGRTPDANGSTVPANGAVVSTLAGTAGSRGSADGAGAAARFQGPTGVTVDAAGTVYVADAFNSTIRKITATGVVTTLAGTAGSPGSADGTGAAASFAAPFGVAVDAAGTVYVADAFNYTIRKITAAGAVTTLAGTAGSSGSADGTGAAASFSNPYGVAVDAAGTVYVGDQGNNTIRKITAAGVVTTLAGTAGSPGSADGTGAAARFSNPTGVTVDAAGTVYVGDQGNNTIRKITVAGVVTTLAGTAGGPGSADGTGAAARFNYPNGVTVDAAGTVYVADQGNSTIRVIK